MLTRMLAVAATCALTATAAMAAAESYTIGIGQFAEHGSLDNCRTGFIEGLAEAGLVEGDRKSTRLNSSHITRSRMPSSA